MLFVVAREAHLGEFDLLFEQGVEDDCARTGGFQALQTVKFIGQGA